MMTLDRELVKEACKEFWDEYHQKIEDLGYFLDKESMMHGPEGISIVASIRPAYSSLMIDVFKKVIPSEKMYKGERIPVIFFPSVDDLLRL